ELSVFRIPPICLVSTGDELVNIEQTPAPHQIRSSNAVALRAILAKWAMEIDHQHILDDEKKVRRTITKLLSKYQIIIFMGGSSMGKFDFIPGILRKSGVTEHFYKIKQRPGKPMWFGSKGNQFVFALPGNPVSCFLCAERYVDAWLRHSLGIKQRVNKAILRRSFDFKPALSYFLQVKLTNENGCLFADPIPGSGSGDHANLANTDAFMELPEGKDSYREGEQFHVFPFKPIL
ncbi:MAG: molybdopterin molybdotransferase MoeA, partial [Saprospiraceae bacterium]|nr:molybdopterin molybdotransferase MoeA [Saprospiraceae bacterium]